MKLREWVLPVAVAVAIFGSSFGGWQYKRALKWETRVQQVEQKVQSQQIVIDIETDRAKHFAAQAAKHETVVKVVTVRVAAVDSLQPPDSSCAPNLAVRDTLIEEQAAEISDLKSQTVAQAGAINLLQASNNALRQVLASRPKAYPRFLGPNIGIGAFVGTCGLSPCGGIGITVNVAGIRL